MTAIYNTGKEAPCTLRFHVATEAGWDMGGIAGCLTAAGLAALGLPLGAIILLALPGIGVSAILLRRYYAGRIGSTEPDVVASVPQFARETF
jgi:hypothetical protein